MSWHGYFAVEDLDLSAAQRQTVWAVLQALVPDAAGSSKPQWLLARRFSVDSKVLILEARFNPQDVTITAFHELLAETFGVPAASISVTPQTTQYGPLWTFAYGGVDKLRVAVFGGLGASWRESGRVARIYIRDNPAKWEGVAL